MNVDAAFVLGVWRATTVMLLGGGGGGGYGGKWWSQNRGRDWVNE